MSAERPILAAGGVLWRPRAGAPEDRAVAADAVEVAVVHRPKYDDWSLPKGKLDPGEHLLETAVRELREETGVAAVLGRPLGVQRYLVGERPKQAHFWAARAGEGEGGFAANEEIDALEWLGPHAARTRVTRPADAPILDAFGSGPVHTAALVVLRHAQAVGRAEWSGPPAERPLSPQGRAQARALAGMLRAYGVTSVLTSPSRRARETVAPFLDTAAAAGGGAAVSVHTEAALTETGHADAPQAAREALGRLLAAGEAAVVSSHRPVLPDLVAAVAAHADVPVPRDPLAPAEMLVCHVAGGRVVAVERHLP